MKNILIVDANTSSTECVVILKDLPCHVKMIKSIECLFIEMARTSVDMVISSYENISSLKSIKEQNPYIQIVYLKDNCDPDCHWVSKEILLEKPLFKQLEDLVIDQQLQYPDHIIAYSEAMQKILKQVFKIAKSHANVFLCGESGTGKEVLAGLIHAQSMRNGNPFITVNCAAIPESLVESEFFGHEKGAFTGATHLKPGRFERAHTGTLLLDEITEISPALQAKLLRVTQERELERVGGQKTIPVDVRVISTSNRNLLKSIANNEFRADLYYRLNVIPVEIPPLRKRIEDILPLAYMFVADICKQNKFPLKKLSKNVEKQLLSYQWPGNIRELRNTIERAVILEEGMIIRDVALDIERLKEQPPIKQIKPLKIVEKEMILFGLDHFSGNRTQTAQALGISTRTLRNKLQEYQLL